MLTIRLIGALLILCGVVFLTGAAIYRGKMSDPHPNPNDTADLTLEPRHRGLRFLGLNANWPGFLMMAIGGALLLLPLFGSVE